MLKMGVLRCKVSTRDGNTEMNGAIHPFAVDLDHGLYQKLRSHCELIGIPMREVLAQLITELLAGRRLVIAAPPPPEKRRDDPPFWERRRSEERRELDRFPLKDRRGMGGGLPQRGSFNSTHDASVETALRGLR